MDNFRILDHVIGLSFTSSFDFALSTLLCHGWFSPFQLSHKAADPEIILFTPTVRKDYLVNCSDSYII